MTELVVGVELEAKWACAMACALSGPHGLGRPHGPGGPVGPGEPYRPDKRKKPHGLSAPPGPGAPRGVGPQLAAWVSLPLPPGLGLPQPPTAERVAWAARAAMAAVQQARRNVGPARVRAIFVALELSGELILALPGGFGLALPGEFGPQPRGEPGGAGMDNAAQDGSLLPQTGRAAAAVLGRELGSLLDDGGRLGFGDTLQTAFEAAAAGGWGILLEAGPRCAAYGRAPDGTTIRAGGRGGWLDEANTFDVGWQAWRAAVRHLERRGPATALTGLLQARWPSFQGKSDALLPFAARAVLEAAEDGDAVARAILQEAARTQAAQVRAVAARLRWPPGQAVPLYLAGELLRSPIAVQHLRNSLSALPGSPPLKLLPPLLSPPAGALLAAARLAGLDVRRTAEHLAPHLLGAHLYGLQVP